MLVVTQLSAIGLPGPVSTSPYDYSTDYYTERGLGTVIWGLQGPRANKPIAGAASYLLTASAGIYSYAGQAATLSYNPPARNIILFAAPANYIYEGGRPFVDSLSRSSGGTYPYLGGAAGTIDTPGGGTGNHYTMPALAGIYSYTGQVADLSTRVAGHTTVPLDIIPYSYTGGVAALTHSTPVSYTLLAATGGYAYFGETGGFSRIHVGIRGYLLTTSTRTVLGPKRVDQVVTPPFDFGLWTTSGDVLSGPIITISVWSGVDPNPQNVYAGFTLSGNTVYVALQGGIPGVIYQILVRVTASLSGVLENAAFLSVLPQSL